MSSITSKSILSLPAPILPACADSNSAPANICLKEELDKQEIGKKNPSTSPSSRIVVFSTSSIHLSTLVVLSKVTPFPSSICSIILSSSSIRLVSASCEIANNLLPLLLS